MAGQQGKWAMISSAGPAAPLPSLTFPVCVKAKNVVYSYLSKQKHVLLRLGCKTDKEEHKDRDIETLEVILLMFLC